MKQSRIFALAAAAGTACLAPPALAHHVMGGELPQTFSQGFLSGLAHPVIGLDHFAALTGIGFMAAFASRGLPYIVLFSAAIIGGVALHLAHVTIPAFELYVALATLAVGALVMAGGINTLLATLLVAAAGAIHGYALGESIAGAEQTPLAAYLLGLAVIQTLVAIGSCAIARAAIAKGWKPALPLAGGAIAVIGALFAAAA